MARRASSPKRSDKRVQWRERLRRFERSKMSVVEFCRREQVSAPAFYQWRRKLSEATASAPSRPSPSRANFVPVQLTSSADVQIAFPNGARLTLPAQDYELVVRTIAAIAQAPTSSGER